MRDAFWATRSAISMRVWVVDDTLQFATFQTFSGEFFFSSSFLSSPWPFEPDWVLSTTFFGVVVVVDVLACVVVWGIILQPRQMSSSCDKSSGSKFETGRSFWQSSHWYKTTTMAAGYSVAMLWLLYFCFCDTVSGWSDRPWL